MKPRADENLWAHFGKRFDIPMDQISSGSMEVTAVATSLKGKITPIRKVLTFGVASPSGKGAQADAIAWQRRLEKDFLDFMAKIDANLVDQKVAQAESRTSWMDSFMNLVVPSAHAVVPNTQAEWGAQVLPCLSAEEYTSLDCDRSCRHVRCHFFHFCRDHPHQ